MLEQKHIDRFFEKYTPVTESGCWLWDGATTKGYGNLGINGKTHLAHRLSWQIHFGEIPKGLLVCHKCDVPACVNPNHLFLGTVSDNAIDSVRKGRYVGNRNKGPKTNGKLTLKQKREIVSLVESGYSRKSIGEFYKVTSQAVTYLYSCKERYR